MIKSDSRKEHWENIFKEKDTTKVSWFQVDQHKVLNQLSKLNITKDCQIIDVGGGDSTLPDALIADGYMNITVLDISANAIRLSQSRLDNNSKLVTWIETNVLDFNPEVRHDVWYDRAVFHFLTSAEDRTKYMNILKDSIAENGYAILGGFAVDGGPDKCSGLEVHKLSKKTLRDMIGIEFNLIDDYLDVHETPSGIKQIFNWTIFQKN